VCVCAWKSKHKRGQTGRGETKKETKKKRKKKRRVIHMHIWMRRQRDDQCQKRPTIEAKET